MLIDPHADISLGASKNTESCLAPDCGLSLSAILQRMGEESNQHPITIRRMLEYLAGRGYPAVIAMFSIPAILPVIAVPMGFVLIFSGLRMALGQKLWIPKRVQNYEVPREKIIDMIHRASFICLKIEKGLKPRYCGLCIHPWSHKIHGALITCIAIMLPLPIPGTNFIYAIPILLIGLGLMENDGLFLLLGDILGVTVLLLTLLFFFLGKEGLEYLFLLVS